MSQKSFRRGFIEVVDPSSMLMRCTLCDHIWSPNLKAGGRLPPGAWTCSDCGANARGQIDPHVQAAAVLASTDAHDAHV